MLGVSESQLRQWVIEGKVHKPYRLRKNVVLFDALTLASDWDRMKEEAEAAFPVLMVAGTRQANPGRSAIRGMTYLVRDFAVGFRSPGGDNVPRLA